MDVNKNQNHFVITEQVFLPKNLSKYTEKIMNMYDKLMRIIAIQDVKIVFYKYFFKNLNKIVMDFNKTGELIFINQPIP